MPRDWFREAAEHFLLYFTKARDGACPGEGLGGFCPLLPWKQSLGVMGGSPYGSAALASASLDFTTSN